MPWKQEEQGEAAEAEHMGANGEQPNDTVYASDLPDDFDDKMLKESFGGYGTVTWSKVMSKSFGAGQAKTIAALVQYASVEEAVFIIENPDVLGMTPAPKLSFHTKKAKSGGKGGGGGANSWGRGGSPMASPVVVPHILPTGAYQAVSGSAYSGKGGGGQQGFGDLTLAKKGLGRGNALPGNQWSNDEGAVFVGGLPPGATDLDLYEIFSPFGAIPPRGVKVMKSGGGTCSGIGFVDFIDPACAQAACATLNGYQAPDGITLQVRLKTPGRTKKKGQ